MIRARELLQEMTMMQLQSKSQGEVLRLRRNVSFRCRRRGRLIQLLLRSNGDEWRTFLARLSKFPKIEVSAGFWNGLSNTQQNEFVDALHRLESLTLSSSRPPFMRIGMDCIAKLLQHNPSLQELVIAPNVTITNSGNGDVELMFPPSLRNFEFRGHLEVENIRFHNLLQCVSLERLYLMPASSVSSIDSLLSKSDITNLIQNIPRLQEVGLYTRFWKVVVDAMQNYNKDKQSHVHRIHTLVLRSTMAVGKHQCRSIARLITQSSSSSPRNLQLIVDDIQGLDVISKALVPMPQKEEGPTVLSLENFMVDIMESKLKVTIPRAIYDGLAAALRVHWNLNIVVRQGVCYNYRTLQEDPQAVMILENRLNRIGRGSLYARDNNHSFWIQTLAQLNQNGDGDSNNKDGDPVIRNFPISRQCGLSIPISLQSLNLSCVYELLRHNPNLIVAAASPSPL